ncbi:MAG: hypothetical protein ACRCZI_07345 [Cetobacterium sp.]
MSFSPEEMYNQQLMSESGEGVNGSLYSTNYNTVSQTTSRNIQSAHTSQIKCGILLKESSKLNRNLVKYFRNNLKRLNRQGIIFKWTIVYEEEEDLYEEQNITKFPTLIYEDTHISGISPIVRFLDITSNDGIDAAVEQHYHSERPNRTYQRGSRQRSTPQTRTPPQVDDLKDYFMNELNNDNDNDNDSDDPGTDMSRRVAAMNKARKDAGLHVGSSGSANPEIHERAAKKRVQFQEEEPRRSSRASSSKTGGSLTKSRSNNNSSQYISTETMDLITKSDDPIDDEMMGKFWENQEETVM